MTFNGERIWVIGASSGIGEALSRKLAECGATLILSARRAEALTQLNQQLGGQHDVYPLDVADREAVGKTAREIAQRVDKLDRVIFMAAIYGPRTVGDMDIEFVKQSVEVNLLGALYCTHAVLPILAKQTSGQLVFCASVAGYLGLPGGQPYSASKAALINFAESLRAETAETIDIKVINPGFVRTAMTDLNDFPMPMCIEVEEAAEAIAKGLKGRSFEIHFPKRFTYLLKLIALLPYPIKLWLTSKLKV